ncbi:MmgE/PrpD family protein [Sporichthya brevicatena]|uniref:MmgE/PrpD family protein n=1 Tax=Sporichthya brevicatena TaxID=171442 RepID=A0ABP3RCR4_9ACTN
MTASVETERRSDITTTLSEYLVGLQFADLPAEAVEVGKIFTLECVGHMVNAHPQPVSRMLVRYARDLGATAQAAVLGGGFRTSVAEAAYVNGSLAHADELESYGTLPGSGLIPPIAAGLAVGEFRNRSGRDYLTALVAGVEMQGRLGTAGIGACDRGFMGISLVGPAGAAVTAGRLYDLTVEQMRHALGTALPLGNGSTRGCGSMAHVHEAGVPARTGVFAAQLAADGFTACDNYLDGAYSWGEQFAAGGARPYVEEKLTEGLGESLFLLTAGVAPKQYGSCGLTHQTIHGTIDILRSEGIGPDDIATVDLHIPAWADRIAPYRDPINGEQAKFSIRHGVAGLLVEGIPELPYTSAFTDEASRDPRYVAARERVRIHVDDSASVRAFADQTVVVTTRDGRTVTRVVPSLTASLPSLDERIAMVERTLRRLPAENVKRLIDVVLHLEDHDLAEVAELALGG